MAEKIFTPEFGPNGAVLNAPGVTPERRQELEAGVSLRTVARDLVLPILIVTPIILAVFWVLQQGWFSDRELWFAGLGLLAGVCAYGLMQRLHGWRRLLSEAGAERAPPPLIWRRTLDAIDFGVPVLSSGLFLWATWLLAVADGAHSSDTAILLVVVGHLASFARAILSQKFLKLAARRGWATP